MMADMFSVVGKGILVTGAAGFLGRKLCTHLTSAGATVFAVDIDEGGLSELEIATVSHPGMLTPLAADLGEESARVGLVDQLSSLTVSLDGVVFAAAFVGTSNIEGWAVDFAHQSVKAWRDALELNLTAPFHLSQLLTSLLWKGVGPSIVNVGSIYGSVGPDWALYEGLTMSQPAGYAASKGGLLQLSRWLSSTLAPAIRVNCVSPGGLERGQPQEFIERYSKKTPLGRMGTEMDVLGAVVYLLSAASAYVTGQEIVIDGGLTAL
jgi:NAD(P)-dependent dehydrogenase (short-subunit alcohol dehydrogenase family)